jgi:quercetin dioxygenase-like cupin family protein
MLWFLDTLVDFPVSHDDGADGISVMDSLARHGDSPPYHAHYREDEVFHLLEGELDLLMGGERFRAVAGETRLLPRDVPHTYLAVSEQARWLVATTGGNFERFVRELSRPPETPTLPPYEGPPTPEQQQLLEEVALRHGIKLLGPPLEAAATRAA